MATLNPKVFDVLKHGTRDQRLYVCKKSRLYFAVYYFSHYFHHPIAPFHFDFYNDFTRLIEGDLDEVAWIAFRESAKTSIAKICVIHTICFKKKSYINWDSHDKENAEMALFDIAVELQTNKKLIRDFGQLFSQKRGSQKERDEKGAKPRRLNNFITENDVKCEAFSTQQSTRGRVWKSIRPEFYVLDDIENSQTKDSYAKTSKVQKHIDELKAGLGPGAGVLYLGNYIIEDGTIAMIMDQLAESPTGIVRNIPVMDNKGNPTWPGRYVRTNEEAAKINKSMEEKRKHKISIEHKRQLLGESTFQTEMMNEPGSQEDYFFDRERVKELMDKARDPETIEAGFKLWGSYNPKHRYSGGADTAFGIGGDHSASVWINLSRKPNFVIGTYMDNNIKPDLFGFELARQGKMLGRPIIVPEVNAGYGTVAALVRPKEEGGSGYTNVYVREIKNRTTGKPMKEYGFWMSSSTKTDVMSQFASAVEDGELEIYDIGLLQEMYRMRNVDVRLVKPEEGQTRHFDKVIAAALAWEGRYFARAGHEDEGTDSIYFNTVQKKGEYDI